MTFVVSVARKADMAVLPSIGVRSAVRRAVSECAFITRSFIV